MRVVVSAQSLNMYTPKGISKFSIEVLCHTKRIPTEPKMRHIQSLLIYKEGKDYPLHDELGGSPLEVR